MDKKYLYASLSIVALAALITWFIYPHLPEQVPSHWNAAGQVDAYQSRHFHVFFFLGLSAFLPILMMILPYLDPKYSNIQKFAPNFGFFVVLMTSFFVALYGYTTLYALGYEFPINYFIIPAISILFFGVGRLLQVSKRNYSIGIRTPWTLNSDKNWDETHRVGSKVFTYGSFLLLPTVILGDAAIFVFLGTLLAMLIMTVGYSFWYYWKFER